MKYSLLISNTTTKEAYVYTLDELNTSSLYYKFDISVGDIPDGEYEYILIENKYAYDILVNVNNPFKSKLYQEPVILVTFKDTLTDGKAVLVVKEGEEGYIPIPFIESGLMRVGDYREKRLQYDKQTSYKAYDRK